jgi:hypothetical protein
MVDSNHSFELDQSPGLDAVDASTDIPRRLLLRRGIQRRADYLGDEIWSHHGELVLRR